MNKRNTALIAVDDERLTAIEEKLDSLHKELQEYKDLGQVMLRLPNYCKKYDMNPQTARDRIFSEENPLPAKKLGNLFYVYVDHRHDEWVEKENQLAMKRTEERRGRAG